jgi:biopolymer transport protein ExbB/TolQ
MQFTLAELWQAMGPLAKVVVIILVGMSMLSLTAAVEKWLFLSRAFKESTNFLQAWRERAATKGYCEAAALARNYSQCLLAQLVQVGTHVLEATATVPHQGAVYDRAVRREIIAAGAAARRGLGVLATVGSTAPFVGLFGTVIGIVNAFQKMAAVGQGGLGVVSAGIAEALVTTALGIGVAIPAVWLFNWLTQRISRLLTEMECVAEELAVIALGGVAASLSSLENEEEGTSHGNAA